MSEPLIICPHCGEFTKDAAQCELCRRAIPQAWRDEQRRIHSQGTYPIAPQDAYGPPPQPLNLASEALILCPHCGKHTKNADTCGLCLRPISQEWRDEQVEVVEINPRSIPAPMYGPPPFSFRSGPNAGFWIVVVGGVIAAIAVAMYFR